MMSVCYTYQNEGHCEFGDKCKYSHAAPGVVDETAGRPRNVCYQYKESGMCKFGASCRYSHDVVVTPGGGGIPGMSGSHAPSGQGRGVLGECWAFKSGTCTFGDRCRYSHGPGSSKPMHYREKECREWQIGTCRYGDLCKFAHGQAVQAPISMNDRGAFGGRSQGMMGQMGSGSAEGMIGPTLMNPGGFNSSVPTKCYQFEHAGRCTRIDKCPFLHVEKPSDD
eukprot:982522_1